MALTPPVTPHASCPGVIAKLIEAQSAIQFELRGQPAFNTGNVGISLAVALQNAKPESLDSTLLALRSHLLSKASSFTTRNVRQLLDGLLSADAHLEACCQTAWGLAKAIEVLSPNSIRASDGSWDEGGQQIAVARMLGMLYESEYQRETYIHIYNLALEQVPLVLPMFNTEIVRLGVDDLPRLIGEATFTSALHDPRTGTCFTKFVDKESVDDNATFQRCWLATHALVQVLKYFKYDIVDMDYGSIYYRPVWVNQIWRAGIRMWGLPRKDGQNKLYLLANSDRLKFESYCKAAQKLKPLIDDISTSLRQATALAGDYFEGHHKRTKPEEKLIDLVIALEILFSPGKEGELKFRITQRAALLIGETAPERVDIKNFLRRMYDARSRLVHAGESPFLPTAKEKLTDEELARLGDYVRQAILRLFILRWRGKTKKDEVEALLDKCALDQSVLDELLANSNFDSALAEILAS